MAAEKKGNSVSTETFKRWGKDNIFGVKTEVDAENGRTMVNFVWCKLCSKHEKAIMSISQVKGSARTAARSFIDGTTSVTKYQVCLSTISLFGY